MAKTIIISIFFISVFSTGIAQVTNTTEQALIMVIGRPPEFGGGINGLPNFIMQNIIYPPSAKADTVEGTVFVGCYVDTLGHTTNHEVLRGIRNDLNEEALRVAKLVNFDKAAMQAGKPIKVRYTIPVVFKLTKRDF